MLENGRANNRKEERRIRRADICLMAFFLFLALGCSVWSAVCRREGRTLRISCDGQIIAEVPLSQLRRQEAAGEDMGAVRYCLILCRDEGVSCEWYEENPDPAKTVSEGNGYNLLAVSGGRVWMEAADCRDQICVHHIPITGGGESIICLPHRLVAEIAGGTDAETLDAVARADHISRTAWKVGWLGHETDG